jgi:hypothetical protein
LKAGSSNWTTSTPSAASHGFLVQDLGERHGELLARLGVLVVERVHHRHRPGQRELDCVLCGRAQEPHVVGMNRLRARHRAHHARHVRVVSVADAHRLQVLEVDALQLLHVAVHEVPARLLAVGNDVDAGFLLHREHETHRVALAFGERIALELPWRPELLGLREP